MVDTKTHPGVGWLEQIDPDYVVPEISDEDLETMIAAGILNSHGRKIDNDD
jgi:hypothetical protein